MWDWISKLKELQTKNLPVAIATITKSDGSTPRKVGTKMLVTPSGEFYGTIGGGNLEKLVIEQAQECLNHGISQNYSYPLDKSADQVCGGKLEVLIESMNVGPKLYIFGGGHVGQALCHMLQGTPFKVHLIDARKEWARHADLPSNVTSHEGHWDEVIEKLEWDEQNAYAVVMTHAHELDHDIIKFLAKKPLKYRGMIGSKSKWAIFRKRLVEKGLTEQDIQKVKSPIGLANTGKSPKEIAISVAAEVLALHYNK